MDRHVVYHGLDDSIGQMILCDGDRVIELDREFVIVTKTGVSIKRVRKVLHQTDSWDESKEVWKALRAESDPVNWPAVVLVVIGLRTCAQVLDS